MDRINSSVTKLTVSIARTREEALANGFDVYYDIQPCVKGHISIRTAARNECIECNRMASEKKRETEQLLRKRVIQKKLSEIAEKQTIEKWFD